MKAWWISSFFMICLFFNSMDAHAQLLDSLGLDSLKSVLSIEEGLKKPEQVIKLRLRKKKYTAIPKEIFQFTNLQYLDLSKNKLKELPPEIGQLQNLQVLILSSNSIEQLPVEIGQLKNLKILNINQNELTILPPQLGDLKSLEHLDLWSNNLGGLPDEAKNLGKLKSLDLRAILLNINQQKQIQSLLPATKIFFSPPCKCGL